mmetsp:Transcript_41158/g.62166  ORF Transcript_41158/g.62166 Transcript_41158/m.62166 type:complete len:105 (+) Transcript_41158:267-581(+)
MGSITRAAPSSSLKGALSTGPEPPGFIHETHPGSTTEAKMPSFRKSGAMVRQSMFRPAFATFVCGCWQFFVPLGAVNDPSCEETKTTKELSVFLKRGNRRAVKT